jgi:hypothetical protein
MGTAKAHVFPVPVWAQPIRSVPLSIIGIACSCIGVGIVYPSSFIDLSIGSIMFSDSKCIYKLISEKFEINYYPG